MLGAQKYDTIPFVKAMLPTSFGAYWFFSSYAVIYLLSPFINKFISACDKKLLRQCILTLFVLWSLLHTFTTASFGMNDITLFLMLYLIGAYISTYPCELVDARKATIVLSGIWLMLPILFCFIGYWVPYFNEHVTYFYSNYSPLTIMLAASIIQMLSKGKNYYSKIINAVSPMVFGVYLLTDNTSMRDFLWRDIVHCEQYAESSILLIYMALVSALIFTVGIGVEWIRINTFKKMLDIIWRACANIKTN